MSTVRESGTTRTTLSRLACLGVLTFAAGACATDLTGPPAAVDGDPARSGGTSIACVRTEQGCTLPGVVVIGHPEEPCDPWLDSSWCKGGGECIESVGIPVEPIGIANCPPGGGPIPSLPPTGGGGGKPPSGDPKTHPVEPDTACQTGDPVIESQAIQSVLHDLWQRSNPAAAAHSQRVEQGGWIVTDGVGAFQFSEFPASWSRTPCGIAFPASFTPPSGVVAWVHTHPYSHGERTSECAQEPVAGGITIPFTYRGDPSFGDDEIAQAIRNGGYPNVVGYIIDGDHIVRFTGTDEPGSVQKLPRCGY
jgi:hypothetical protein